METISFKEEVLNSIVKRHINNALKCTVIKFETEPVFGMLDFTAEAIKSFQDEIYTVIVKGYVGNASGEIVITKIESNDGTNFIEI